MGGGDLNMKKSWHPLLLKNQERVWLEEKKALEEKKKLDQLRKEKEEERQLQELQRLQEEQTGKKRTEKLEWMYTTPATGSNQNPNDLEDYLLGKKRVDKILTADDNAKLGASHKSFIAVQNANTVRDITSKIREDPLLMMKQQEQAAYQALLSNPLRLRELQERNGIKPKKSKEKKEKGHKKEKGKMKMNDAEYPAARRTPSRSLSPMDDHRKRRSRSRERHDHHTRRSSSPYARRSGSPVRSQYDNRKHDYSPRSRSPDSYHRRRNERVHTWPRSDESDDNRRKHSRQDGHRSRYTDDSRKRRRSPSYSDEGVKRSRASPPSSNSFSHVVGSISNPPIDNKDRAARLAAMQSNATTMDADRQKRLLELLAKEKAELEAEDDARSKSRGMGGFLGQEQKRVFGGEGGLEDRIRRGRSGLVVDAD